METKSLAIDAVVSADDAPGGWIGLVKLLVVTGLAESTRDARRLISQGGVSVDGTRFHDIDADIPIRDGLVVCVGRGHGARVRIA